MREKPSSIAEMSRWLRRTQERSAPYTTTVLDTYLEVHEGVFTPAYYPETEFYARHVLEHLGVGDRYLDVGCGVGATAVLAARKRAWVTAVDLNPAAVANTRRNVEIHRLAGRVRLLQSDVYSALADGETFDVIFWNVPFGFREPDAALSALERAVFDPGYAGHQRFFDGAGRHLKPGGTLLVGVSPTLGDAPAATAMARERGFELELVASTLEAGARTEVVLQLHRGQNSCQVQRSGS